MATRLGDGNGKKRLWKSDWFPGVLLSLLMLLSSGSDLAAQSLERKAYDLGMRAANRTPSDRVAVIAIDDPEMPILGAGLGRVICMPRWLIC